MSVNRSIIELSKVNFKFPNNRSNVLSNIDLQIEEGEFIVITGMSGSGKSTLALLLSGFIPHLIGGEFSGNVYYHGLESNNLTLNEISQLVGLVQQDPENQIVTPTVFEEIIFGPENLNLPKKEIFERLKDNSNVLNLQNILNRSTNQLSGGEKQKVVIASILAMGGSVLVLDEPISFLDNISQQSLLNAIKDLNQSQKKTVIVIDHQAELYKDMATRFITLDEGKIIGDSRVLQEDFSLIQFFNQLNQYNSLDSQKKSTILDVNNLNVMINERKVLRNITLQLHSATTYGIIGKNGSGKSTLAQTLLNLNNYQGTINLIGKSTKQIPTHKIARKIGIVYQNPNHQIFEHTVSREILFAPRNFEQEKDSEAKIFLDEAKLLKYSNLPPFGLSFGEKRRLTICSSEIYTPDILILDEPFVGQDFENFSFIIKLIQNRKSKGQITILISHRSELMDIVDFFFILDKGVLIKSGSPTDLSTFIKKNKVLGENRRLKFVEEKD